MQQLMERTQGLVLLTGTPMPVHPAEVRDLLCLLGRLEEGGARRTLVPWHIHPLGPTHASHLDIDRLSPP